MPPIININNIIGGITLDVDQIIVNSLEYSKSSLGKVATLGAIIIVPVLIMFILMFLGAISNNGAVLVITLLIAILLLIVAGILVQGYFFKVIKSTVAGLDELPDFDNWGEMGINGLKVLVVTIVYNLIFGIIAAIPIFIIFLIMGLGGIMGGAMGSFSNSTALDMAALTSSALLFWGLYLGLFIIYLIMLVVTLLYAIFLPLGIANMAYNGNIGDAFALSALREKVSEIRWAKAIIWVLAINFVYVVAFMISYILGLLLVGIVVVPLLILPFLVIFHARSIGLLYLNE